MKLAMIGSGYVGLVSGVCFSDFGHDVICVDRDAQRVSDLRAGQIPIYEPGLGDFAARNAAAGRLSFSTDLRTAVAAADAVFIAVGTPTRDGEWRADLDQVFAVARSLAPMLSPGTVVVCKSTVPVGTNRKIGKIVSDIRGAADIPVASNPEFLREGSAIGDFMRPDRVVIGAEDARAAQVLRDIYKPLYLREFPIVVTGLESAELIKYAANGFLATKIAFINEMASLCEAAGGDVGEVARGIGLDRRIGDKFLRAGPGYGGSCFPKDTRALAAIGADLSAPQSIVEAVVAANEAAKHRIADRIVEMCGGSVAGLRIAILGVTFKPETDDMREAPSLTILPRLRALGADIVACDPQADRGQAGLLEGVTWAPDAYAAATGADAVVILTEWNAFRALDLREMAGVMRRPRLADTRNIYTPEAAKAAGFEACFSVGRARELPSAEA